MKTPPQMCTMNNITYKSEVMLVNQIFMGENATESGFNIRGCPITL